MWVRIVDAIEKSFSARPSEEAILAINSLRYQMDHCRAYFQTYRTSCEQLEDYCFCKLQAVGRDLDEQPGIDTKRAVMDAGFSLAWTRLDTFVRASYTDQEIRQARLEVDARRRAYFRHIPRIADARLKRAKRDDH